MKSILRQPLLHFCVLGAAIFALNAFFEDAPPAPSKPSIVVSPQDATWLVGQFQATWRRPPTEDELNSLMDEFVREEIYVREALALGLDQGDTIVRRRLRQKMEFLTEAGAEAATPSEESLLAHLEANASTFARAPKIAFEQLLVPNDSSDAIDATLAALADGADPETLASPSLLPGQVPLSPPQAVDGIFGAGFFSSVAELDEGVWSGPVRSGFGTHVVRLIRVEEATLPPLDEIRDRVELDWRATMARDLRTRRFEELKAQYVIERPDASGVLSQ